MSAIWSLGQAMFTKVVLIVDHDVDVQNSREVVWKALCAIDPERDIQFVLGSGGHTRPCCKAPGFWIENGD